MKINFQPLLIAASIGFIIQIFLILLTDVPTIVMASPESRIHSITLITGCLSSLLALIAPIGIGMIYPLIIKQQPSFTSQSSVIGGGIAVLLASVLGTVFLLVFRWYIIPVLIEVINPSITFERVQQILGMTAVGVMGYILIFLGGWIMNTILGSVGGAIGFAWVNRKKTDAR